MDHLLNDLIILARHMAREYAGTRGLPAMAEDLQQEAVLALLEAETEWDPNRGVPFARYALAKVAGAIRKLTSGQGGPLDLSLDYLLEAGIEPVLDGIDWSSAVEARELITQWLEEHWAVVPQDLKEYGLDALSARLTEAWLESRYQARIGSAACGPRDRDSWGATEGPAVSSDGMFPSEERRPMWMERPTVNLPLKFKRGVWEWAEKANPDGLLDALEKAAATRRTADGRVVRLVRIIDFLGEIDDDKEEMVARRAIAMFVAGVLARRGQDRWRAYDILAKLLRLDEFQPEPEPESDWIPPSERKEVEAALNRVTDGLPPWHRAAVVALVRGGSPEDARQAARAAYEEWRDVTVLGFPPGTRRAASVDHAL